MKLLALFLLAGTALAKPLADPYAVGYGYNYINTLIPPANSQHHAQDDFGQYNYGYTNKDSAKVETKTADGVVRGSYSYVDANGVVQTTNYISDAFGYRVAATNLPIGPSAPAAVAEVKEVAAEPLVAHQAAVSLVAPTYTYSVPYAPTYHYQPQFVPTVAVAAQQPVQITEVGTPEEKEVPLPLDIRFGGQETAEAQPAQPAVLIAQPFHVQDEAGQYQFGYSGPSANRIETRTADGVVTGSYNYVDDRGQPQLVNYIADHLGFRVQGSTIPFVQHALPVAVVDTPEVVAAREEHARLVAEEQARQAVAHAEALEAAPVVQQIPYAVPAVVDTPEVVAAREEHARLVAEEQARQAAALAEAQAATPVVQQVPYAVPALVAPVANVPYVAPTPQFAPVVAALEPNQFHAQDDIGRYSYGYANQDSFKTEHKDENGIVRGSYSYIDANGQPQRVDYISDAFGFRVSATNLPIHNPVVPVAPVVVAVAPQQQQHVAEVKSQDDSVLDVRFGNEQQQQEVAQVVEVAPPQTVAAAPAYQYVPYAANYGYQPPIVASSAPVISNQFHAQDEFGNYNYGYANPNSAKSEVKSADGVVRGSYSYVDANGIVQTTNYISDAFGFRVAATNLPIGPTPVAVAQVAPVPAPPIAEVKSVEDDVFLDVRGGEQLDEA